MQAPVEIAGISIHASPSIGIALYPADGDLLEVLLAHADAAMYAAKQRGRSKRAMLRGRNEHGSARQGTLESDLHRPLRGINSSCTTSPRSTR
jgi:predicted signal transduction protein with EAL and GGDEF domain